MPIFTAVENTTWFSRVRRHGLPLILVTVLILIAYPSWFLPGQYGLDDISNLNVPQRTLLAWFYHSGSLPLWNPFSFGGQPFLAAGQSGPLYIPNLVYLLMPIGQALKLSYLLHELLCAYGMYALVNHLGRNRLGAVVSSISLATCGFFIGHQVHTQMFDAFAWLPMIFWLMLRVLDSGTRGSMMLFAGSIALEVFAGHPQMTFYILLTVGLYVCGFLLQNFNRKSLALALKAGLSVVMGLALSAPQWFSTADFITYSDRAHSGSSFLLAGSMPMYGILQFFTPFSAGGGYTDAPFSAAQFFGVYHLNLYWEFLCYVGLVTLVVALTTVFSEFRRVGFIQSFSLIALVGLSLSFGGYSGLHSILTSVPGFDFFRIPSRYIAITDFCISVLAGVGIGRLQKGTVSALWKTLFTCTCFILALVIVVDEFFGRLHYSPSNTAWVPCVVLVVLGALNLVRGRIRRYWVYILSVTSLIDVTYQSMVLSPEVLVATPFYSHPSTVVTYLQQHLPKNSVFTRVAVFESDDLSHDRLSTFQIPTLNGYDALEPSWYAEYVDLTWTPLKFLSQPETFVDDYGVKYVITNSPNSPYHASEEASSTSQYREKGTWRLVAHQGNDYLWANPDRTYPAWVASSPNHVSVSERVPNSNAILTAWAPNHQTWQVTTPTDGVMVLSQTFDPNWTAAVDGKPVHPLCVDHTLTGIPLASGRHSIVLQFQPKWTRLGLDVSLLTLAMMVIWALTSRLCEIRRRNG